MKIKNIIYDYDGTLCDSISGSYIAACRIFDLHGCPKPSFEEYVGNYGPPYTDFYRDRGVIATDAEIWECYSAHSDHAGSPLFPDVVSELWWQKHNGCSLSLVTGQQRVVVEATLRSSGCLSIFDHMLCDVQNKAVSFREACERWASTAEARSMTAAVGDFSSDMMAAVAAGVIPIGIVRNGEDVSEVLYEAGAVDVIKRLYQLRVRIRPEYVLEQKGWSLRPSHRRATS